jgi:hypothetical protein
MGKLPVKWTIEELKLSLSKKVLWVKPSGLYRGKFRRGAGKFTVRCACGKHRTVKIRRINDEQRDANFKVPCTYH